MRRAVGLSHTQLAAAIEVARCTILTWEHQNGGPRPGRQAALELRLRDHITPARGR